MDDVKNGARNGAEAVLAALKGCGVDWFFANAGTDFPTVIEGLARLGDAAPTPVTVPHEGVAVGMAHGFWLATGRPQAVMVHVNVGLANAAMGVINAASDDVPMLVMSGRTPITEAGREGSRATPIQYGQEMYDQASLVSDLVKHHYEMRYPEQGGPMVARALSIAGAAPGGPVYLSLPREPLAEALPSPAPAAALAPVASARPDEAAVERLADWLREARRPVILAQRGDPAGRLGATLSRLANAHGIRVAEPFSVRNLLASDDPALLGYDPGAMRGADLVVVLDASVPWIELLHAPGAEVRVVHVAPDPLFRRMPVRGYRTDLAIAADPLLAVEALEAALGEPTAAAKERAGAMRPLPDPDPRPTDPITPEWLSRCVSDAMDEDAVAVTELGLIPSAMRLKGPNRLLSHAHSGGLGWALPAAMGAQLARPGKLTIAAMGDGSYMFANPPACHQVMEALGLPVLTVVKNNAMWNAVRRSVIRSYPDGAAARMNRMPLTSLSPQPDFAAIARASRAHAERVERGTDLPAALARAVEAVRGGQPALLDVAVAATDRF